MFKKIIVFFISFCFAFEQVGFAQIAGQLDISARMSSMIGSIAFERYRPLHLRYLSYDQLNNDFKLLLDKGTTKETNPEVLEKTTGELLKYFFIGIALPNDTFWVNLRPDSPNEIINDGLAKTDMGKVMLECDLQLKKDTAKYTSPETLEGRAYWDKLYKKAEELYGSENITIPTLTRPWIVPDEIIVREAKGSAYIYKATLKVMLEQDYLKGNSTYLFSDEKSKILNEYSSQIIRESIIPKLTREVNSSKRYAPLRQVYYSLILAQWFKEKYKGNSNIHTRKIDSKDLANLTSQAKWDRNTYFKAYQKSFKDGEYNIRENRASVYGQTIRTYFSGGENLGPLIMPAMKKNIVSVTTEEIAPAKYMISAASNGVDVVVNGAAVKSEGPQIDGGVAKEVSTGDLLKEINSFPDPGKVVLFFDIDNTLIIHTSGVLSVKALLKAAQDKKAVYEQCVYFENLSRQARIIESVQGIKEILSSARERDIKVFIVTNREPELEAVTKQILKDLGLSEYINTADYEFLGEGEENKAKFIRGYMSPEEGKSSYATAYLIDDRSKNLAPLALDSSIEARRLKTGEPKFSFNDYLDALYAWASSSDRGSETNAPRLEILLMGALLNILDAQSPEQISGMAQLKSFLEENKIQITGFNKPYVKDLFNKLSEATIAKTANGPAQAQFGLEPAGIAVKDGGISELKRLTEKIKNGESGLIEQRKEIAVSYLKEQLGERIVDGKTVGNNEIVAIVEAYIRDQERTDVQVLFLEGEHTDKIIGVLKNISVMASQSLGESLVAGAETTRKILATQEDLEILSPILKQKSAFYPAEEIAKYANYAEYWKDEEWWIKNRKTTDPRWSGFQADGKTAKTAEQEERDAQNLLSYARDNLEPKLAQFLEVFVQEAGLRGFVNVSYRTKGLQSAMDKLRRLKEQPWSAGKDVSIADLVDLLGGRIVVDDLKSLEKVMLAVERIIKDKQNDPSFQGMRILRKENKFIANDGKADPYRAVQYTITFPGKDGEQFTFELQLKTFSAMIASDIFHNAVYKPEVLNLPGDLQQTVRDYNWQSDVDETKAYLGEEVAKNIRGQGLSYEQKVERAIEERDFNSFYDLVLSKINSKTFTDKAEWIRTYDFVNKMLNKEIEFLNQLKEIRPDIVRALARASHDNGYYKTKDVAGEDGKSGVINDPGSIWLKPELSKSAAELLTEAGKLFYAGRYERFRGNNQKLTVGQLDLQNLSPEALREFFQEAGKDVESPEVKRLIQDIENLRGLSPEQLSGQEAKKTFNKPVINLYHQSFDELSARGREIINAEARGKWNEAIINNQIKAIATSVLLTEIGGVGENGQPRDLGRPAIESAPFSIREKLIHEFWVFALQYNGEYAFDGLDRSGKADPEGWRTADPEGRGAMNYEKFVTATDGSGKPSFANQIGLDRTIDVAIIQEVVGIHLKDIAGKIIENRGNPIKIAGLQRAKAEIIAKYIKTVVVDQRLAGSLVKYIDAVFNEDSETLLRGNGGAKGLLEKIISLSSRSQLQRDVFQKDLIQLGDIAEMPAKQRNVVDLVMPIISAADFDYEESREFIKIIKEKDGGPGAQPLTIEQIKTTSSSLPVVADLREKLETENGLVLYGAGGTGKSEQLDIALGVLGRSQDVALFDLRKAFLSGREKLKDAYRTSAELKNKEFGWLDENKEDLERKLVNSPKSIVVFDEFDLAIGQTLNEAELKTANLVIGLAARLQQKGKKVILIVHYKGIKTPGFLGALGSQKFIANDQSLVQTRYLPSSVEDELLAAMGIENSPANNNALSRFKELTQGIPTAYLGFMEYAAELLKKGGSPGGFRPSFVELAGQASREIEKNYIVLKKTGNPETAVLMQELAKGSVSLEDDNVLAQREELLATGLVGEKDGIPGAKLVMAPLVSDVVNLLEGRERIKGLPKEYESYLDTPHFNAVYHNEGGRSATLKDHLLAHFAALRTAVKDENIPLKARDFLRESIAKNRVLLEAFILLHDVGKVTHNTVKADGISHSFQGHEQASANLLNNPIFYGDFDVSASSLLKLIIKNHIFAFTVDGREDIERLEREFAEQGIIGDDFVEAMKILISTTTLDLLSSEMDEYGNSGQTDIIERMIQAFEDFQATQAKGKEPPAHIKARTERPEVYPQRYSVPDEKVSWNAAYPDYSPQYFVSRNVLENDMTKNPKGYADPEDFKTISRTLTSYEGPVRYNSDGIPLNPRGRTGIKGRGLLGKWGANFAADPIVTRINPETGEIEMLAILRDNGQWAIPGGMVDAGETISATLAREFLEETGVKIDMSDAEELYRGYVDDPRNTDNAWMETIVKHKHISPELAALMQPKAGSDAKAVKWLPLNEENLRGLYASHGEFVRTAISKIKNQPISNPNNRLGGIDFRALPIITQPMGEVLMKEIINMPAVNIADLDQEWQSMQKMIQADACPSTQRIKEFLGACYQKGELKQRADNVLECLAGMLRAEEDECKATEPETKIMLALLEYNR